MTSGAYVIYIFAKIREMAKKGLLDNVTIDELQPPLTAEQTNKIIADNQSALQEKTLDHEDVADLFKALHQMQAHNNADTDNQGNDESGFAALNDLWSSGLSLFLPSKVGSEIKETNQDTSTSSASDSRTKSAILTHFMDDNAKDEIVNAIIVNQDRKRVTVVFRGSTTIRDFQQDAKMSQKTIDNPVYKMMNNATESGMSETINVHKGFYEYLFKQDKGTKMTRFSRTLNDAKEQLRQYPGFQLYVTGHSLGGALSTLFGFFAAADEETIALSPQGVVIYSIASPFVGNLDWRFAFQELERQKRLQHLRVANQEDMVTLMPFAAPKIGFFSPAVAPFTGAGNLYKHVGIQLSLTEKCRVGASFPYSISYPKDQSMDSEEFAKEVQNSLDAGKSLMNAFKAVVTKNIKTVETYHRYDTHIMFPMR